MTQTNLTRPAHSRRRRGVRTTSTGSTVTIQHSERGPVVLLDHPDAPADLRHAEAGRIVECTFQPVAFCPFGLRPETLRAIADLIDELAATETGDPA